MRKYTINIRLITGNSLPGKCLTKTRLGFENICREIREIDAQLVSRARFLKERLRKTELGLKIANMRKNVASSNVHITFVSENVVN